MEAKDLVLDMVLEWVPGWPNPAFRKAAGRCLILGTPLDAKPGTTGATGCSIGDSDMVDNDPGEVFEIDFLGFLELT